LDAYVEPYDIQINHPDCLLFGDETEVVTPPKRMTIKKATRSLLLPEELHLALDVCPLAT
jgi:hypothetical protein